MKQAGKVCLALLLAVSSAQAQGAKAAHPRKQPAAPEAANVNTRLDQMEKAIAAQQQQISQLLDQLRTRDSQVTQLQQQLAQTQTSLGQVQQTAAEARSITPEQLEAVKRDQADTKEVVTNSVVALQETQRSVRDLESPVAMHFKGITITPGGFLAAESVYRTRALGADINTPFNSISFPGSGQNAISEFFASGRQSRVSMLAEGKVKDTRFTGYVEADFLSAGVTSNNNQSNSYTMRERQLWGQIARHGWSFTGGQQWSLLTETKKGADNRSEAVPLVIDAQYTAGFSWARQPGFRVVRDFHDKVWLAASLENPQTTFSARGNASNFAFGGPGNGGGLYNTTANYSFNAMPDVIAKAIFEPGFGHYEIFGIFSRFRDRVYPCVEPAPGSTLCAGTTSSAFGAYNASRNGGGVGANARFTFAKQLDFGLHALAGNGVGRYGTSGLPDATVNADGTLALLRNYQGLATIELHHPKWDLYFNAGGEYAGRRWQNDPVSGKAVGYGSPLFITTGCFSETAPGSGNGFGFGGLSNCNADTRVIIEGSAGFWYRIYNGPKGKMQFGPQYSYVTRNSWAGTGGTPHGIENLVFTSFRYYLP